MKTSFALTVVILAACSKSSPPPATPQPGSAPATEPTAPAVAEPSAPALVAPTPVANNKCTMGGGRCENKFTTGVCKKFDEDKALGCGENEGCCSN